jgi:hypothetical protein
MRRGCAWLLRSVTLRCEADRLERNTSTWPSPWGHPVRGCDASNARWRVVERLEAGCFPSNVPRSNVSPRVGLNLMPYQEAAAAREKTHGKRPFPWMVWQPSYFIYSRS